MPKIHCDPIPDQFRIKRKLQKHRANQRPWIPNKTEIAKERVKIRNFLWKIIDFDMFRVISVLWRIHGLWFSLYFCNLSLIRNWSGMIFGQRKFLILIRFGLFQVYWDFKVLWFTLYFCNFDLDPELIRNWSGFDLECFFQFCSKYFWRRLIILMLIFPISIATWNPSI